MPRIQPHATLDRRARIKGRPMPLFLILAFVLAAPPPAPPEGQRKDARPTEAPAPPKSNAALVREGRAAYDRGDKAAFLAIYEDLARRRPGEVFTLYNLACARALNGRTSEAVRALEDILAHRVASNLDADTDFDSIRQTEGYRRVVEKMSALRKERISSGAARAFTIPEKGLVAEGVAYDPVTKAFFVSSVRRRRIVRVAQDGTVADFVAAGRDGLRSALGMRVDPKRRTLWVASQAIPSMDGYEKDQPRATAVFEYDVDSGRLRKEHRP